MAGLIVRVYLGWQWLSSDWGKFNNPTWVDTGEALKGFWTKAIIIPKAGRPLIAYGWYCDVIQFMLNQGWYTWFAKVVTFSALAVGLALILGAFVGIAAFGGALLNWNFIMAGTASTNAMLFTLAVLLMLAWKVAGWYDLNRFLLPLIGTPGSGSLPNPHGCQKHTRLGRQCRVKKQLPASLKEGVRCNRAA